MGVVIKFPAYDRQSTKQPAKKEERPRMSHAAIAPAPSVSSASLSDVKSVALVASAAYAFSEAIAAEREALFQNERTSAGSADYARDLVFTGLSKLAAFERRYKDLPQYLLAHSQGDDLDAPQAGDEALTNEIRWCAETARECDLLGPAAEHIADTLEAMLGSVYGPRAIERVSVHVEAAEKWLRAKSAKATKR